MFWPIVACVLLPWLLVYLGLHVVQRGIIFIDIAMAQMASLGICLAVLLRFEPESLMAFVIALGFTLLGAAIFSLTGKRASQVPQEAIIGIAYVVAAAAAVLLLSRSAARRRGNQEHARRQYPVVSADRGLEMFRGFRRCRHGALCSAKKFLLVSFERDEAYERGWHVRWWDFLFYASFGFVVTIFVRIAGVLLVFSYLIVPAVCGVTVARSFRRAS